MTDASTLDRDAVLAVIRQSPGEVGKREIARALRLPAHEKIELKGLLKKLEDEGLIERRGRRGYTAVGAVPKVGVVVFTGLDGEGDLIGKLASHELDETGPSIRLSPGDSDGRQRRGRRPTPAVGVGDRALCRLGPDPHGEGVVAQVIKKFERRGRKLLGVVRKDRHGVKIIPVDKKQRDELIVRPVDVPRVEHDDLVVFGVEREKRYGPKTGEILEIVGRADAPQAATVMALHAHDIPIGFSEAELEEVAKLNQATAKGREDLTDIPLITIDPEDARDHDDAVWAEPDRDAKNLGGWVVIVAIADVSAYVASGGPLDAGAETRANSVYFPDRVVPMLPERLSTDLCSLREGEARPCMAVRMVFAKDGAKRSHTFVRGWMRSAAKLAYEDAQAAIDGKPGAKAGPLLENVLKPLWAAYRAVDAARTRRAPLNIDAPERRIRLNEDGSIASIEKRERFDAHKLIEEFMIQANVCAAESLELKRAHVVYRVHDTPARDRVESLAEFLPEVGLSWTKGQAPTSKRFNALLAKAAATPHADVVNEMVLRTQSQAVYATENIGHFGLNLARYAHFTSPIRRYADLLVHRALIAALGLGDEGLSEDQEKRLDTICQRISDAERRGMAAEREATDRYISAHLAAHEGSVFKARISGVTRAGLFLKLEETGADGLAPISTLGAERFVHDARAHALIGEDSGGRYTLGKKVEARLVEATPLTGGLLFAIVTPPDAGPPPSRKARGRSKSERQRRGRPRRR